MQSKLLRAIQENGFMRVGGSEFIKTDIRYISATNISLDDLFSGTKFRQDLYYRLSVVLINIPDIKDRKEDIIPLTSYFLNKFNKKHDRNVKVRKETMKLFMEYDWTGNVREIKNVMERMIILVEGDYIEKDDFKDAINLEVKNSKKIKSKDVYGEMTLSEAHDLLDKTIIEKSIKEQGSILSAVKALGVDPSTIHRKLKK